MLFIFSLLYSPSYPIPIINHIAVPILVGFPSESYSRGISHSNAHLYIKAFASPAPHLVLVVGAVFLLCVVAALALTVVLRPLPSDRPCCRRGHEVIGEVKGQDGTVSLRARIAGTLRLLTDIRLVLLIPTIVMMGILTSFAIGAFNQVQNNIVDFFDFVP